MPQHTFMSGYPRTSLINRVRYRQQDRNRMIDFMIIGIAKCGTTWLSQCLDDLTITQRSEPKETQFFKYRWREKFDDWDLKTVRSIYLRRHWPHPRNKILFEASPGYLSYPPIAKRIKKYYPRTKFVVLLREPAERVYSHYNMWVRNGRVSTPFAELYRNVLAEARAHQASSGSDAEFYKNLGIMRPQSMISFSLYYYHLSAWFQEFDRSQFHIMTTPQLNDRGAMDLLMDFLGMDTTLFEQMQVKRSGRGHHGMPMTSETRDELQEFFAPFNQKLFNLLGVDHLEW